MIALPAAKELGEQTSSANHTEWWTARQIPMLDRELGALPTSPEPADVPVSHLRDMSCKHGKESTTGLKE